VNSNTIVEPIRESSIINVRYNSPNPEMAATVANSIAENFVQSNLTRRFEAAAYARQFIQNRLNQVRAKLEESERKAVEYAARAGLINIQGSAAKARTSRWSIVTSPR
jgi:succinoglycan biosynthesis transport protein ExoP